MKYFLTALFCASLCIANAQESDMELPFRTIPDAPEDFTATTVAARMVDGLGFRYYWATEGLRAEDLAFKPSENGRTVDETLDHIMGLVRTTMLAIKQEPNERVEPEELTFEEKRAKTLNMLKEASDILHEAHPREIYDMNMKFVRGDRTSEYPFWNLLNGPMADAIWHVGQVVTHRRSSGNPFNSKVSVFSGILRE